MDPVTTESGWDMHTGGEICIDDFQANRAPARRYRTSRLNGLWTHMKGGFYHSGRFATLADVLNHYDSCMSLELSPGEKPGHCGVPEIFAGPPRRQAFRVRMMTTEMALVQSYSSINRSEDHFCSGDY